MTDRKTFRQLMDEVVEHGQREQMEELGDVFDDLMEMLHEHHPEMYDKFYKKVEAIMQPDHLTEEEARKYVSHLHHKDGTKGEYFSYKQIEEFTCRNPELAKYDKHDIYYVINMLHSDFYKQKWDVDTYVMFALMWMDDPDGKCNKAKVHAEVFHS